MAGNWNFSWGFWTLVLGVIVSGPDKIAYIDHSQWNWSFWSICDPSVLWRCRDEYLLQRRKKMLGNHGWSGNKEVYTLWGCQSKRGFRGNLTACPHLWCSGGIDSDLLRVTHGMLLGGVFPANRTSDSYACGRFTAEVAPILSLSSSLSSQSNDQPGLTKISRSSWPTGFVSNKNGYCSKPLSFGVVCLCHSYGNT